MARYKKKPVVVEAFRIGIDNIPDWAMDKVTDRTVTLKSSKSSSPFDRADNTWAEIKTLEGTMKANHGDYIIKGINGELYPCKPDIFEKTYELVEKEAVETAKVVVDTINKMQKQAGRSPLR